MKYHPITSYDIDEFVEILSSVADWLYDFLRLMPLPQGILTSLGISLGVGYLGIVYPEVTVMVSSAVGTSTVFVFGTLTLWLLRGDRRKDRWVLAVGIILMMLSNLVYIMDYNKDIFVILHNCSIIVIMLFLFLVGIHARQNRRKGRRKAQGEAP